VTAKTTSAGPRAAEGLTPGADAQDGKAPSVAAERKGYDAVKRALDILAASAGLLVLSPVFLLIGAGIRAGSTGGVFYRGIRVGRFGAPFRIWKFRTMTAGGSSSAPTSTSEDDPRITRVGRILRRSKLDELPQLLNVLTGQMSLVGPRPQVPWAVAKYSAEERRVLTVRPGITDWASLRFHNEGELLKGQGDPDESYLRLIHPEKMRLAIEYVDRRSLKVDATILFRTIKRILLP
jgi:lipopolysaccharide/colanic/teichoic acid biosynthesis glycosyltransferase